MNAQKHLERFYAKYQHYIEALNLDRPEPWSSLTSYEQETAAKIFMEAGLYAKERYRKLYAAGIGTERGAAMAQSLMEFRTPVVNQ